jgi:hydroxypyruvate isomerase
LSAKELRKYFVENTGKRLAEQAAKHGTLIVLEPLRRNETPFLRQVADGATIARDIGPGAAVMGDFWHMQLEETSFMGAFISGGPLLKHVHIAGLQERIIPGAHPEADNYVDGFKGLKLIGYRGSQLRRRLAEGSCRSQEGVAAGRETRLMLNMVKLLREQWALA